MSAQTSKKKFYIIKLDECKYIGSSDNSSTYLMKDNKVVKIYQDPSKCKRDYNLMTSAPLINVFPQIYDFFGHYIVRDYIKGTCLKKYIIRDGLNDIIAIKLIEFLEKIYNYKIGNLDIDLNNIFISNTKEFILVDAEYTTSNEDIFHKLFNDLNNLNVLHQFLALTKSYNINLYNKWVKTQKA